jgi:hypothetical protein
LPGGIRIRGHTLAQQAEGHRLPALFFGTGRACVTFSRQERQTLEPLKSIVQPDSFRFLVHICDTNTNDRTFVSTDLTFLDANSIDLFLSMDTTDEHWRNSEIAKIKFQ